MISLTWTWPNFIDSGENKVLDKNVKRLWTGCQFTGSFYKPGCNSRKQTNRTLYQISQLWAGSERVLILLLNLLTRFVPWALSTFWILLNPLVPFEPCSSDKDCGMASWATCLIWLPMQWSCFWCERSVIIFIIITRPKPSFSCTSSYQALGNLLISPSAVNSSRKLNFEMGPLWLGDFFKTQIKT